MGDFMEDFTDWLRDALDGLSRLLASAIAAAIVNCGLIYGGWYAWEVFTHTYSGETFKSLHPERTRLIEDFLAILPYWQTALELAAAAAVFSLAVALVCQFIYLRHLLYETLWRPLRVVWAVGLSFVIAWFLLRYDASLDSYYSYVVIIMPSMACVLPSAMKASSRLLPDIGTLVIAIVNRLGF